VNEHRKRKLSFLLFIMLGIGVAVALALYALRQNINLFYTPTQVLAGDAPKLRHFRVGGLVVKGSVQHVKDGLTVSFNLTDTAHTIQVQYTGILPDLFREGQGIVAQGQLNQTGNFVADQVLAKHDENYMPPEVKDALAQARHQ